VRGYQKYRQKEKEHYRNENQQLRDAFGSILTEYKTKMESPVESREKEVFCLFLASLDSSIGMFPAPGGGRALFVEAAV
jgi:hypothetical protein